MEVIRAAAVDMPALEDPEALRRAGLGSGGLDEAMRALATELDAEQGEELLQEAAQGVLDQLAHQTEVSDLDRLIDAELDRRWEQSDGAFLADKQFSEAIRGQARAVFLADPRLRAAASREIRAHVALGAIVEQAGLTPSRAQVDQLLAVAAENTGLTPRRRQSRFESRSGLGP